jgi:hypothetical protein
MKIPTIHPDLKEFLHCLKQQEVRFVVGGSYVMAVLGRPRFGLAQFVKAKRAAGRAIDLADLALLEEAGLLDGDEF